MTDPPSPSPGLPANLADLFTGLRLGAVTTRERDAVNLLIAAGWTEDPGFRRACLDLLRQGMIGVNWPNVRRFEDERAGPGDEGTAGADTRRSTRLAALTHAYNHAVGRTGAIPVRLARLMATSDGTVLVLFSDGSIAIAANRDEARQLVPDGFTLI